MSEATTTTAQSSGVLLDDRRLKKLARRSDRPGLRYLVLWAREHGGVSAAQLRRALEAHGLEVVAFRVTSGRSPTSALMAPPFAPDG